MNKDEFNAVNKLQKELAEVKDERDEALERIHVLEREARYHQQELDGLLARLRKTQDERDAALEREQALAAYVEMLQSHTELMAESSIGTTCLDSGRCHHGCTEKCWRRTECANLSISDAVIENKAGWPFRVNPDATSKRDLIKQAEVLEKLHREAAGRCSITITREALSNMAADLRRQAEGADQ